MWGPWGRVPARHVARPASGACGALEGRGPVTRVSPDCPQGVPGAGSGLVKVMTGGQPTSIVTGSLPSPTRAAWWLVASPTAPKVPQGLACCVTSRSGSLSVLTRAWAPTAVGSERRHPGPPWPRLSTHILLVKACLGPFRVKSGDKPPTGWEKLFVGAWRQTWHPTPGSPPLVGGVSPPQRLVTTCVCHGPAVR